ncbi:translationally-controlled tumor protein homolog [Branchiostoma lanceolatum]|uniref:translationally-controlled tumor protein homolog n=1 Tax=Branchiostoma lanceolatum TaxID=7740 RepID=UPI0034561185
MESLRAALLMLFLCGITTHLSTGLTIYKDLITGDEMFSDIFKMRLIHPGILYEVEGSEGKPVVKGGLTIEDYLMMEDADPADNPDIDSVAFGADILLNHDLQETSFTKEQYTDYVKGYVGRVKAHLQEVNPDRVDAFLKDYPSVIKKILNNFKNWQFFIGKSKNKEGMVALLDWRQDGRTPYMLFFKDGLEEEKA